MVFPGGSKVTRPVKPTNEEQIPFEAPCLACLRSWRPTEQQPTAKECFPVPDNFVEWARALAVQFRTEGATDELIEGVTDFDHKVRAQGRETMDPGSRSSPSKKSQDKSAAAAATTSSVASLDVDSQSLLVDEGDVQFSPESDVDDEEEEDEGRGRLVPRELFGGVRGRSLSPRLCELVGRAFLKYIRERD
ncbi:hypothetical protein ZTR_10727 [Talaromyces verruculosus]|nr:hypothetical protein ZTR_10727 [Talaromyces verruculosus]